MSCLLARCHHSHRGISRSPPPRRTPSAGANGAGEQRRRLGRRSARSPCHGHSTTWQLAFDGMVMVDGRGVFAPGNAFQEKGSQRGDIAIAQDCLTVPSGSCLRSPRGSGGSERLALPVARETRPMGHANGSARAQSAVFKSQGEWSYDVLNGFTGSSVFRCVSIIATELMEVTRSYLVQWNMI